MVEQSEPPVELVPTRESLARLYVRSFPAASEQTQISIAGGTQPEWRRDGKELFYISADGKLTADAGVLSNRLARTEDRHFAAPPRRSSEQKAGAVARVLSRLGEPFHGA